MRRCKARTWDEKADAFVEILGVFHQFGLKSEELGDGVATYTSAIVEDIEGQVWEAEVSSLKFLDVA